MVAKKYFMIAGLVLAASGIAAFHQFQYPLCIVFLAAAGLGLGMFCVSSLAFLNERVSGSLRGTISGAFYFCWGAGYFFGPLIIGKIGSFFDFPAGFSLFSGLIVIQLVVTVIFIKP